MWAKADLGFACASSSAPESWCWAYVGPAFGCPYAEADRRRTTAHLVWKPLTEERHVRGVKRQVSQNHGVWSVGRKEEALKVQKERYGFTYRKLDPPVERRESTPSQPVDARCWHRLARILLLSSFLGTSTRSTSLLYTEVLLSSLPRFFQHV